VRAERLDLTDAERARGLNALLLATFLMWGGFFLVVPLISVHFVEDLGFAASSVGLALALRQLGQQGFTVFGGALADRFGARGLILLGLAVRALGFGLMGFANDFAFLMLAVMLSGIGGALFEAPSSAAIAAMTTDETRSRYYALRSTVASLGMTTGPFLGALLFKQSFLVCYVLTLLALTAWLPQVHTGQGSEARGGLGLALRDRRFVWYTAILMGYWFMWVQLNIAVSLEAVARAGTRDAVSWVFGLNAGMTMLLQYPAQRFVDRFLRPITALTLGCALMALGFGAIALTDDLPLLLVCVAVFSLGGVLAAPSQQNLTARLANPNALGSYFGVSGLSLAVGGGIGNYVGGWLYGLGVDWLPWLVFALAGTSSVLGLLVWRSRYRQQEI
jgi:MFS transporter, DHA1 family, multidrug resistance protein